jgi:hypothetical protein
MTVSCKWYGNAYVRKVEGSPTTLAGYVRNSDAGQKLAVHVPVYGERTARVISDFTAGRLWVEEQAAADTSTRPVIVQPEYSEDAGYCPECGVDIYGGQEGFDEHWAKRHSDRPEPFTPAPEAYTVTITFYWADDTLYRTTASPGVMDRREVAGYVEEGAKGRWFAHIGPRSSVGGGAFRMSNLEARAWLWEHISGQVGWR